MRTRPSASEKTYPAESVRDREAETEKKMEEEEKDGEAE